MMMASRVGHLTLQCPYATPAVFHISVFKTSAKVVLQQ
jgi:hypothetical protein